MDIKEKALKQHEEWQGKIEVTSRARLETPEDLSIAYTPGVAEPCLKIAEDKDLSYKYTRRGNMVAVVTDGTAVLGLGDIGPEAGMPVMEGKCVLFKEFGGVDAFPICVRSKDVDDIVNTVALLAGSFGGVNLEDISAPRCFEIEKKLKERCDIPIFHDDQHGTAVVTAAAMLNALKVTMLGLEIQHAVTREKKEKAEEMMRTYGLADFKNARPSQLSGGMRQRAALIRTLVLEPALVLLDEPFSALDYQTRLLVSDDIGKIIRQEGKTALLVTHDISEAISMADRVLVLTKRPAHIQAEIPVLFGMEHRTPMACRNAPEFKTYFNQIWKELNQNET